MSRRLISRSAEHRQLQDSADLQRLQDDGYEIEVRAGNLLIGHVPFRNAEGAVAYGTFVCPLDLAGNVTAQPNDHVLRLTGGVPHDEDGNKWMSIIADESPMNVAGLTTSATLSQKPLGGDGKFRDFHHKMTTYVGILAGPARRIDADATAQTFPVFVDEDGDLLFNYIDTASSRAGITETTAKLKVGSVAIVGLGGTGSYILDYIAKTPVEAHPPLRRRPLPPAQRVPLAGRAARRGATGRHIQGRLVRAHLLAHAEEHPRARLLRRRVER